MMLWERTAEATLHNSH